MNWTEVVTGMLRMSYATDLLFKFEELHGMKPGSLRDVQMSANMAITMNDPAWFEKVLEGIGKNTNEPLGEGHPEMAEHLLLHRNDSSCAFGESGTYLCWSRMTASSLIPLPVSDLHVDGQWSQHSVTDW